MKEDLRGVFFIVKGQYRRKEPIMLFKGNEYYIGGYDPEDEETKEWYRVIDREAGICIHAGVSLEKALNAIRREIIRSKNLRTYLKSMKEHTRNNTNTLFLDKCIDEEYGYYYRNKIGLVEDEAYAFLRDNTSVKKAKRRFKRIGESKEDIEEQVEKEVKSKGKSEKMVMHRIKLVAK